MKSYLYTSGEVTLLLVPIAEEQTEAVSRKIMERTPCDAVVYLVPSLYADGELRIYDGRDTDELLAEALCACAFHLTYIRGLPLFEYSFIFKAQEYLTCVDKESAKIRITLQKCKEILSEVELLSDGIVLKAKMMSYEREYLCLEVSDERSLCTEKLSLALSRLPKKMHLGLVVCRFDGGGVYVRYLPYGEGERGAPLFSYALAVAAHGEGGAREYALPSGTLLMRGARMHAAISVALRSVLEYDIDT